jgi:tRNA-2-methylthio-N6-dimethylallyladenosine synthase
MNTPGKLFVKTFGCQMNVYDTEKIYAFMQDKYLPATDESDADVIILNTCSIRDKAEHKVYSLLGRLKSLKTVNPGLVVGVGGCVAQQEGEKLLRRSPVVDVVFGTHNVDELPQLIDERLKNGRRICRIREDTDRVPTSDAPRVAGGAPTALLTIMKGCDNYCAYCVVPLVRGREVSRPLAKIVDEALHLAGTGVREITLLGQNVNSYSDPDTGTGFVDLLEKIDSISGIERLRFVTSHPKDFSPELARAMAELPTICEHVHLPVQSGSDRVLKAMGRGYSSAEYLENVTLLKELVPEVELTTDIIVGFPGETREDFEQTLRLIEKVQFQNAFSFRFSSRPGTRAAEMENPVTEEEKRPWLPEFQAAQNQVSVRRHQAMMGQTVEVLVEGVGKKQTGRLEGRSRTNFIVHFNGDPSFVGRTVQVMIKKSRTTYLEGELLP